ncbi:MAG: M81 family metallopeptidase [Acidimicrobiaceae bacterium]|jgi:microcystin degradation protein MlrC|nr:M81 family metallopeptidase [Acidimicrobiaceae bacterium]MBT5850554.1 M81 family metallopeptidase [Acidimicrobiaceae bacterium]
MSPRYVLAEMMHETNTFSPQLTDIDKFGRNSPNGTLLEGAEAIELFGHTNTGFGGFYELLRARDAIVDVPVVATAWPAGLVTDAAFEEMAGRIVDAAQTGPDAMFLALHGAMVTQTYDDAEGELLRRIRAVAPDMAIAVSLDFHLGMSPLLCANATVVTGFRTYPHIDVHETAQRAGRTLLAALDGEVEPMISWGVLPMMTNMLRQTPSAQPMKDIMDRAIEAEASGEVLTASVFGGFPLSDIPHTGLSVIVVSDGDKSAGDRLRDELLTMAWDRRADFVFDFESMETSVARAASLGSEAALHGPIVLADHGDNCGAGGITDVMAVLEEAMKQGLDDLVAGPYCDPSTVELATAAGVGAEITVSLGGKIDMPAIGLDARPLTITARVAAVSDGRYLVSGPMGTGTTANIGNTVLLEAGGVDILVSSLPLEPFDLGFYTHIGIDPAARKYLLIKSRQHFRAVFEPIASEIIPVAGPGVCSEDYSIRTFDRIRRPMYPMDLNTPLTVIGN